MGIISNLGFIAYRQGKLETARAYAHEALAVNQLLDNKAGISTSIRQLGMAMVKDYYEEKAFALELCCYILNHPALIGDTRTLIRPLYDRLAAEVEAGVLETAEAQARERDVTWYWDELLGKIDGTD